MKKANNKASHPFSWELKKGIATLRKEGKSILSVDLHKKSKAVVEIGKSTYDIRNKGYWSPRTFVERKGKPIAILDRKNWDKTASIVFSDGYLVNCFIDHHPNLKLTLKNKGGKVVCSFQADPNDPKKIIFHSGTNQKEEEKNYVLIALGRFVFHGMTKEFTTSHKTPFSKNGSSYDEGHMLKKAVTANS